MNSAPLRDGVLVSRVKHLKFSLTLYFLQRIENRLLVADGIIPFNARNRFVAILSNAALFGP